MFDYDENEFQGLTVTAVETPPESADKLATRSAAMAVTERDRIERSFDLRPTAPDRYGTVILFQRTVKVPMAERLVARMCGLRPDYNSK
jgi:hypothetical protein